ncbi:FHA domain-containing protein [Thermodesulfobacteriota bacterium]
MKADNNNDIICSNCSYEKNKANWKYCKNCGALLASKDDTAILPKMKPICAITHVLEDGKDGEQYFMKGDKFSVAQKVGDIIFPHDPLVSQPHLLIYKSEGRIFTRDQNSKDGSFLMITKRIPLKDGDILFIGGQHFVFELPDLGKTPPEGIPVENEKTDTEYKEENLAREYAKIIEFKDQVVRGNQYPIYKRRVTIGRKDCDLSFPWIKYISRKHCSIEHSERNFFIGDLKSTNGTFIRMGHDIELNDKDVIRVGNQKIRIELKSEK